MNTNEQSNEAKRKMVEALASTMPDEFLNTKTLNKEEQEYFWRVMLALVSLARNKISEQDEDGFKAAFAWFVENAVRDNFPTIDVQVMGQR